MPIHDCSILEIIIKQLSLQGFGHITLAVNHQADIIQALFGNGKKWNIQIDYSLEQKPLSTIGPLKLIKDLPEDFLVMNGDILSDLKYGDFFEHHEKLRSIFTISSYKREHLVDYGVLETDTSGQLLHFREKPVLSYEVSTGVYMVNKEILASVPDDQPYGFDNLMIDLLNKKTPPATVRHEGYWLDIGRPEDYMEAINQFETLSSRFFYE
jgi:NDP-sugar pyrophosphorylase family protein